ncbi:MAG TPA: DNA sulfur modification protein DndB [Clostridium sp.]|uniref:DNA sulfur modification protein DndB n=1 Tax=Clostridium sp. TaxID=1506 RepID=UPI002F94408E
MGKIINLNDGSDDADMIQKEMENDEIFDRGSRDGKIEEQEMKPMQSLSERVKLEDNDSEEKTEQQLKKETRKRLKILNNAETWNFNEVVEIFRNGGFKKYQTVASAEFLGNLYDQKIAIYQGELQRGYRYNKKGDQLAVRSNKQINLILEAICKDSMHGGFITLNLNSSEENLANFDEDEHTLTAPITQKLQILDGQHRLAAFSKLIRLYKRNPESVPNPSEYFISVAIETLNDQDSKSLFSEYATKSLKINRSRGEFLNVTDNVNKLCRSIMDKSDMQVEVVSTSIKSSSHSIITFGVFSKIIKDNYSPQTKKEIESLSNYLTLYFDCIIETFPEFMASKDLERRSELRKQFLTMEPLAWSGYAKISTLLQGKSSDEMLKLLDKFNSKVEYKGWKGKFLSRENPIFWKIMREGNKIVSTSSSTTWINKVFTEFIIEGKSLEEIGREEVK